MRIGRVSILLISLTAFGQTRPVQLPLHYKVIHFSGSRQEAEQFKIKIELNALIVDSMENDANHMTTPPKQIKRMKELVKKLKE